jgi:hypothetical protein
MSLYEIDLSLFKINRKTEVAGEVALDVRMSVSLELGFLYCRSAIHF